MLKARQSRSLAAIIAVLFITPALARGQAADIKGSKDHPAMLRFAGAKIFFYEEKQFDEFELLIGPVKSPEEKITQRLEGKVTRILYALPVGISALEATRNYTDSMKQSGFVEMYFCAQDACGGDFKRAVNEPDHANVRWGKKHSYRAAKLERPGKGDLFASVYIVEKADGNDPTIVQVYLVELKSMAASMVKVEAKDMASGIASAGKVALYGLYFDFDKAEIKPESDETLAEITKLLKGDPNLKLYVIGHTDNKGTAAYNVDLSQRRAASVVQRLAASDGIDASRLAPAGVGPYAPVAASNKTEEGQAKNRRVELVER